MPPTRGLNKASHLGLNLPVYEVWAKISAGQAQTELLEDVDQTATELFKIDIHSTTSPNRHWTTTRAGNRGRNGFLALTAEYGLQLYIRVNIECASDLCQ